MTERDVVEIAGLRRRFAALVYEGLLLIGVWMFGFFAPTILYSMVVKETPPPTFMLLNNLLLFGFYFLWYWRGSGQTLAMQTWRLRLVTANEGKPLSFKRALLRFALCWPSVLLFGAGLWWAFIDRDKQFAHDRLAGTVVVLLPGRPS